MTIPAPQPVTLSRRTDPAIVVEINILLDQHTDGEIAEILQKRGRKTGSGLEFDRERVKHVRIKHDLPTLYKRLLALGRVPLPEMAKQLRITYGKAKQWRREGIIVATRSNDKDMWLCHPLNEQPETARRHLQKSSTIRQPLETPPTGT